MGGVGGATLLRGADRPYVATAAFDEALAWKPDVALVQLGTNDTCLGQRGCWTHERDLEADAGDLVRRLREANPAVVVWLASPTPIYSDRAGLDDARRQDLGERAPRLTRVQEALRTVAREERDVWFHDLTRVFAAERTIDGVHPDAFGADALAEHWAEILEMTPVAVPDARTFEGTTKVGSFHGFPRHDVTLDEGRVQATLVLPHAARAGLPWIWRARFFGHQPGLDLELLDRGFALAYVDVSNLYGNEEAVRRMDLLYAFLRARGFSARPILEGMSRGGLAIVSYALAHPERCAALYGDNPVFDLRSWPGGQSGKRSDADWQRALAAHGFSEPAVWERSPAWTDALDPLVEASLPVFLVVGADDHVVPPHENALPFAARYRELGGHVEVWSKPGADHHPHGLHPPAPLRRALMRVVARSANPAVRALPSCEFRGGPAGWGGGTWRAAAQSLCALAEAHPTASVVFLGDSITQGLTGHGDRTAHEGGNRAFDRWQGKRGALSLGLSGDRTEHLLYRIDHGALAVIDPRAIVLQIGVNNVNAAGHTGFETAAGIAAVAARLREREPQAKILICGPFPTGATPDEPRRQAVDEIHRRIGKLDDGEHVFVMDLRSLFLQPDGRPNANMRGDAIHITPAGQEAWLRIVEPWFVDEVDG